MKQSKYRFAIQPPDIVRRFLPQATWRLDATKPVVYLTFDDGPTPEVTQEVLDILLKHEVLATFFCIGDCVVRNPEIYQQILDQGHAVGNHTFNHLNGWSTPNQNYFENIEKCAIVVESHLYRPPFGRIKPSQYNQLLANFKIILWDVLAYDWDKQFTPNDCINHVMKYTRNGSIIVFHDSEKARENCLGSLDSVIQELKKKGFQFGKIT